MPSGHFRSFPTFRLLLYRIPALLERGVFLLFFSSTNILVEKRRSFSVSLLFSHLYRNTLEIYGKNRSASDSSGGMPLRTVRVTPFRRRWILRKVDHSFPKDFLLIQWKQRFLYILPKPKPYFSLTNGHFQGKIILLSPQNRGLKKGGVSLATQGHWPQAGPLH